MSDAADNNSDKVEKSTEASAEPKSTGTALVAAGETTSAESTAAASWFARIRAAAATAIPSSRAAMAAGGIGLIVGAGLLAGAVGLMGIEHLVAAPKPTLAPAPVVNEETRALKQAVAKLERQIVALKATVGASAKRATAEWTQITERHEHTARSQAEMQTRLAKIGDTVERLEKRVAAVVAAEATGSVAPRYAATAAAQRPPADEIKTPPPAEAKAPPEPPVAAGWVIRDVFRGRAVVASRRGVFEAAPGLYLPSLGRVETVTRRDGRWAVVTENGIITEMRRPRSAYGRH